MSTTSLNTSTCTSIYLQSFNHYYIHLGGWEWTQQVEQRWTSWTSLPSQIQNEWDESIMSNCTRVVQKSVDSLLGFVRKCELVRGGHYK